MSVATVKAVIQEFICSDVSRVLVLKGAWGVGKTHLWKHLNDELEKKAKPRKYAYASLFGLSTIAELRESIVFKLHSLDSNKDDNGRFLQGVGSWFSGNPIWRNIPYVKHLSIGLDVIAPFYIRDAIICLDDFERRSDSIKPDELLGFVSELKEERNCKVVLIMNEDKLKDGEKAAYAMYREKVVDFDLLFDPTSDEAIEIAIPPTVPMREMLVGCCRKLGIKNIRVLRRIVDFVCTANERFGGLHPLVMEQAVATITLFTWAFFDRDGDKPDVDYVKNWNRISSYLESKEKKEKNPSHEKWRALLLSYGWGTLDEFDGSLIQFIERGYLEGTNADEMAIEVDAQAKRGDLDGSLNRAWKVFRESFGDNEEAFAHGLYEATNHYLEHISVGNLNSSVSMLRTLRGDKLADELIDGYVDAHKDSGPSAFNPHCDFSRDLDSALLERLGVEMAKVQTLPSLRDSLMKVGSDRSWSQEHSDAINGASEQDFYDLFMSEVSDLALLIATALHFNNGGAEPPVPDRARQALLQIAKTSAFNAVRVKAYLG
jgi:hypothetical protein